MLQSISPYALLCASKPKQPRSITTPYDLFSLSQTGGAPQSAPPQQEAAPAANMPARGQSEPAALSPAKRTHYIADIHARHANAMRRAPQSSNPL